MADHSAGLHNAALTQGIDQVGLGVGPERLLIDRPDDVLVIFTLGRISTTVE